MNTWHVPFHVIENEWTDDQFYMFLDRAGDRVKRENKASKAGSKSSNRGSASASGTTTTSLSTSQFIGAKPTG